MDRSTVTFSHHPLQTTHTHPKAIIKKIKEEFMQLRHKGETIDKITGIFLDKLKFCG
uniref:Uncharacterized protein n=1 Tax=Helianthus annuus TaxID=4232 RepID=A0A251VRI2_HELAN